ncbi:MAG: hypothetical protein HRU34_14170 [Richelia sp.]|nr:hypothetical protein [Richelia sp.]
MNYNKSSLRLDCSINISIAGVAESGDDFTKFSTIYQWFQTLIHPRIQQRHFFLQSISNVLNTLLMLLPLSYGNGC